MDTSPGIAEWFDEGISRIAKNQIPARAAKQYYSYGVTLLNWQKCNRPLLGQHFPQDQVLSLSQ